MKVCRLWKGMVIFMGKIIGIIIAVVVLIGLAGFSYWFGNTENDSDTAEKSQNN
jgi:flagellar basal body-associated protein FliL